MEYKIRKSTFHCIACPKEVAIGEVYYSVLSLADDQPVRMDFCPSCFASRQSGELAKEVASRSPSEADEVVPSEDAAVEGDAVEDVAVEGAAAEGDAVAKVETEPSNGSIVDGPAEGGDATVPPKPPTAESKVVIPDQFDDSCAYWQTRRSEGSEQRKSIDFVTLRELFFKMAEHGGEEYRKICYLVSLVLIRKRLLKLDEFVTESGVDYLVVSTKLRSEPLKLESPDLHPSEFADLRDKLTQLLDIDFDEDGELDAGSPPNGGPAGEGEKVDLAENQDVGESGEGVSAVASDEESNVEPA